ncbi:MAG: DUF4249 domain-containing protein [Bacteroidales bacterium]|nr:DUF4249 domain-containing protein [Bacteroidales bacterium]MCF8334140.1 DUF4249 domain-containing protein [Bacteroidales bacterium]
MIRTGLLIVLIPLLLNSGCREEFMPDVEGYDDILIVDGMVTNEPGPYTIKLSRSAKLNKPDYHPLPGCEVTIYENTGESEKLEEVEPGVYKTSEDGLRAETGNSYKLSVVTPDGSEFESDFIEMKQKVGVENINAELEFHESNEYPRPMGGYQFFLTSEPAGTDVNLLWKLSETYEFTSDFKIQYIYRGHGIESFTNSDTLYRCWKTQDVDEFFVATTKPLQGTQIKKEPLHFVNSETKRLQVRYSLQVKQYNISERAYEFWTEIRDQIAGDDFLFSSQPYQIRGNVRNVDDAEEPVMGFFTVGAVTKERIFVNRPPEVEFFFNECVPNTDLRALAYMGPNQFPVYLTDTEDGMAYASDFCFDCTMRGGKLAKPDFWVDEKKDNN